MRAFLEEIRATLACGIWSPALASAMLVPDACGAIEYPVKTDPNQGLNRQRYVRWYDKFVKITPRLNMRFDGEVVWKIRNAMLHEIALDFKGYGYDRVLFQPPNRNVQIDFMLSSNNGGIEETALMRSILPFCEEIIQGAEQWLQEVENDVDNTRLNNLDRLLQYRPLGLAPHVVGLPVIA